MTGTEEEKSGFLEKRENQLETVIPDNATLDNGAQGVPFLEDKKHTIYTVSSQTFPLPDPEDLKKYKDIGFADKLVEMVVVEQAHRHELEKAEQQHNHQADNKLIQNYIDSTKEEQADAKRGQLYALIIVLLMTITGGAVAVFSGNNKWVGALFPGIGVTGIVATFIHGRYYSKAG